MVPKIFIPIITVVVVSIGLLGYIVYKNQEELNRDNQVVAPAKNKDDVRRSSILEAEKALTELRKRNNRLTASSSKNSVIEAEKALTELRKRNSRLVSTTTASSQAQE